MNSGSAAASDAPHVLLATASADTRTRFAERLAEAGFDVVQAADGREALTRALMHPPSLVVLERELPFIDGPALCEILRKDRTTARIPIFIFSRQPTAANGSEFNPRPSTTGCSRR